MFLKWKNNKTNGRTNLKSIGNLFKELYRWNEEELDKNLQDIGLKDIKFYVKKRNSEISFKMQIITSKKLDVSNTVKLYDSIYSNIFKEIGRENGMDIKMLSFHI